MAKILVFKNQGKIQQCYSYMFYGMYGVFYGISGVGRRKWEVYVGIEKAETDLTYLQR